MGWLIVCAGVGYLGRALLKALILKTFGAIVEAAAHNLVCVVLPRLHQKSPELVLQVCFFTYVWTWKVLVRTQSWI